jgi:hypothetical protein
MRAQNGHRYLHVLVSCLVLFTVLVSSLGFTPAVYAQDSGTATPVIDETPAPTATPSETPVITEDATEPDRVTETAAVPPEPAGDGDLVPSGNAPVNDNRANAILISSLPFAQSINTQSATLEAGEQVSTCGNNDGASVWYRFNPAASGVYTVESAGSSYDVDIAVYQGSTDLVQHACRGWKVVFTLEAGTTYWVQVSQNNGSSGGLLNLKVLSVNCSSTSLCLTVRDNRGIGFNEPSVVLYDSDNNKYGEFHADNFGFLEVKNIRVGNYKVIMTSSGDWDFSDEAFIEAKNVAAPGIVNLSAEGLPLVNITAKSLEGSNISGAVYFVDPEGAAAYLGTCYWNAPLTVYATPGTYHITVFYGTNVTNYMMSLKTPVVVTGGVINNFMVDGSQLTYETIIPTWYDHAGVAMTTLVPYSTNEWVELWNDSKLVVATPDDWIAPFYAIGADTINYEHDPITWRYWIYIGTFTPTQQGRNNLINLGGPFTTTLEATGAPFVPGQTAKLSPIVQDAYGHRVTDILIQFFDSDASLSSLHPTGLMPLDLTDKSGLLSAATANKQTASEVTAQEVWYYVPPKISVFDPAGRRVSGHLEYAGFDSPYIFNIPAASRVGSWKGQALVDLGYGQESASVKTNFDVVYPPPQVKLLTTNAATADKKITAGETTNAAIKQFLVTFSQPMVSSSSGEGNSVTNPANYSLVEVGADGAAGGNDDTRISITSAAYTTSTKLVTLNVNGGVPLPSGNYVFAIRENVEDLFATHLDGNSDWIGGGDFKVAFTVNILPPSPSILSPADKVVSNNNMPVFKWQDASQALKYRFEIAPNSSFTGLVQRLELAASDLSLGLPLLPDGVLSYTSDPRADGIYFWRVAGINSVGGQGAWSPTRTLTIDTLPPATPELFIPASGQTLSGTALFIWGMASGALNYRFEFDTSAAFDTPEHFVFWTTQLSFKPGWMEKGTYFWRVCAGDPGGNTNCSPSRTISIQPLLPAVPVLNAPSHNIVMADPTPTLAWNRVPYGNTYQIQIGRDAGFLDTPERMNAVTGPYATSFTVSDSSALADGKYYWRVAGVNADGTPGNWSTARAFTVDTTGPSAPSLKSPAINATLHGAPTFTWNKSIGAVTYQLLLSLHPDLSDATAFPWTTKTTLTLPVQPAGELYWGVIARDNLGNLSQPATPGWAVKLRPALPAAPKLKSPATNSIFFDDTPGLSWLPAVGGDHYQVQIAADVNFLFIQQDISAPKGDLSATASSLQAGKHFWRVIAFNSSDEPGPASLVWAFTLVSPAAPALISPADGASMTGTPAFRWSAVTGAADYQLQYDEGANFSTPDYTSPWTRSLAFTPLGMNKGVYYWRVCARDSLGYIPESTCSAAFILITYPLKPAVPVLLAPASNLILADTTPTFTWSSAAYGNTYQIQISQSSSFYPTLVVQNTTSANITTYTVPDNAPLPDGKYYWRLKAINADGLESAWSSTRGFTVDVSGPAAPALLVPANAVTQRGIATFSWLPSATAVAYQVGLSGAEDFSDPVFFDWMPKTSSTLPPQKPGLYYWAVRAKDSLGNVGAWSTARSVNFLPLIPTAPLLESPVNTANLSAMPTLSWHDLSNYGSSFGTYYRVQVSTSASFTTLAVDQTLTLEQISYAVAALEEGKYYWRVMAYNVNGEPGPWSNVWVFSIP